MEKNYKNKAIESESVENKEEKTTKIKVETFFFPPQDEYPEFSCQASSLEEAERQYKEFKENKK